MCWRRLWCLSRVSLPRTSHGGSRGASASTGASCDVVVPTRGTWFAVRRGDRRLPGEHHNISIVPTGYAKNPQGAFPGGSSARRSAAASRPVTRSFDTVRVQLFDDPAASPGIATSAVGALMRFMACSPKQRRPSPGNGAGRGATLRVTPLPFRVASVAAPALKRRRPSCVSSPSPRRWGRPFPRSWRCAPPPGRFRRGWRAP